MPAAPPLPVTPEPAAIPAPKPKPSPPQTRAPKAELRVEPLPDIGPAKSAPGAAVIPVDPTAITVGILLPLTGEDADLGQAMLVTARQGLLKRLERMRLAESDEHSYPTIGPVEQ